VVYPLENQDPEELAKILNDLNSAKQSRKKKDTTDSKIQKTTVKTKIEEDITITPDPKTYSLIVYASKKNQQWISSLIRQLDNTAPRYCSM